MKPQFTHYLSRGYLRDNPLVIADIGAQGGIEPHWSHYGDAIYCIGFEPNQKECDKLNKSVRPGQNFKFYPVALFKDKGDYTFYHTHYPMTSGLYPGNSKIINRFPGEDNFEIKEISTVKTTDLDSFVKENNILNLDFIKLDAEGADLDILKGAMGQLKYIVGISCEAFFSPWRGEYRTFTEIEQFLRKLGFRLYDLELCRSARKAFPGMNSVTPKRVSSGAPYGQIIFGQALFFRDPIEEIKGETSRTDWNTDRILKTASLFEIFGLPDCAIELLIYASKNDLLDSFVENDIEKFCDLITVGFLGERVTYKDHMKKLAIIKEREYVNDYEFFKPWLRKIPYWKNIRRLVKKIIRYD
ncbi:MAG: FkbM family methyltransferase [Parcubacteria group bacterium]|nr:FkbM family methyltransferase [Parcubacteria group bacterium]